MRSIWMVILILSSALSLVTCKQEGAPPPANKTKGTSAPASEQVADKDQLIDVDVPPQLLNRVVPRYPESAKAKGIEGKIYVKAFVDTDGTVMSAEVIKRDGNVPELGQSAVEAAKEMKFAPAKKEGKPVKVWVTIPFKFALQNSEGDDVLSKLKHPNDPGYVEGYLEGLQATERQIRRDLENLRVRNADTQEVERTLEKMKATISTLQAHLSKLKGTTSSQ
jgi:TonB family protein